MRHHAALPKGGKAARLPQGLSKNDPRRNGDIEGTGLRAHGNANAKVRIVRDFGRNAGALAADHQDIAIQIAGRMGGLACPGGEQDQTFALGPTPSVKPGVAVVLDEFDAFEIIHARAPERGARKREAGGMDDMHRDAQAGAQAQQGPRVEGDIGLIKGKRKRQSDPGEKLLKLNWV